MTDIALNFAPASQTADLALIDGDLATDDGLRTAVIISIFTDARALDDSVLPYPGADRRGWWGDAFNADPNDSIGSHFWLLEREKLTPATALRFRDAARRATAWLVDDQVVRSIDIETLILPVSAARPSGALAIGVAYFRPDGPPRQRFDLVWDATARSLEIA